MHFWAGRQGKGVTEKTAQSRKGRRCVKNCAKGCGKKRATATNKLVATPNTELATAKNSRLRLIEVATHSETDANKAQTDLQNPQTRFVKVEQEETLTQEDLDIVREQSVRSVKAAEIALRQLTEMSNRDETVKVEAKSLKSQMDGVVRTRDAVSSSANEKGRKKNVRVSK